MTTKHAYQELEKLHLKDNETFQQLVKNSFDIIVLLDSNGIQHYVSESCERILGFRADELLNIDVIEKMIHPEDQAKTKAGLLDILENSKNGGVQYRHLHKNGSWVYLESFGTNQIKNPLINSVVLNVRDVSENKKVELALMESEIRLKELNAKKDRFLSIIGHDLKNPFNSVIGFSTLLLDKIQTKDYNGIEKYAEIIQSSSKQAMSLLSSLIEWSQSQTNKIKFNPEYFQLPSIIDEVIELSYGSAQQKYITISKITPNSIEVFSDKAMVSAILRNLISNAIKFTNIGGEIIVRIEQQEKQLIIAVADNGEGLKKEALQRLFCIEHNHSTVGTANEKGTGLGLLICKEFTDKIGGEIWVESELGSGSEFKFTIPINLSST